jgi:hypothetical protein
MIKLIMKTTNGSRIEAYPVSRCEMKYATGQEQNVVMMMLRPKPMTEVSEAPKLSLMLQ